MKLSDLRGVLEGQIKLVVVEQKGSIRNVVYEGRDTYRFNDYEVENLTTTCVVGQGYCGGYEVNVKSLIEIRLIKELESEEQR